MIKATDFLTQDEQREIVEAIRFAEKKTSGEIRIHIETENTSNELERTIQLFYELEMNKTKERNAVLIHVSLNNQSLAIYGDEGIHSYVSQEYWNEIRDEMIEYFKIGKYKKGLVQAILKTGLKLKEFFPYQQNDKNELSDEISFS